MAILLIHTGGTIGMAQTPDGFAPRAGVVEDAVAALVASGAVADTVKVLRLDRFRPSYAAGLAAHR